MGRKPLPAGISRAEEPALPALTCSRRSHLDTASGDSSALGKATFPWTQIRLWRCLGAQSQLGRADRQSWLPAPTSRGLMAKGALCLVVTVVVTTYSHSSCSQSHQNSHITLLATGTPPALPKIPIPGRHCSLGASQCLESEYI